MIQQHLNHRIHQEKTDALDLNSIAKEFAQANVSFLFFEIYLHAIMNFKFITLISVYQSRKL